MIDTKLKMGIVGAGLVALLGGCGEEKNAESKTKETEQVYVLPEVYTLPVTCAEVVSIGAMGRFGNEHYVSCKEVDGRYGVYALNINYDRSGWDKVPKGYEWERVKKYQHAEKK